MSTEPIIDEREGLPSASAWERVHYCAGSVALIKSLPTEAQQSSSEAAESGTRIHAALESGDSSELDMTEGEIRERLSALEKEAVMKWLLDNGLGSKANKEIREERFWVFDDQLDKVSSAKVDYAAICDKRALVLDFKSGYKTTTPAQRNLQAKVQAVAIALEHGLEKVRVVIAQHRFTSMVTQADYEAEDLQRAYQEILYDAWRAEQPDAQRIPGRYCDYCPAKTACPEIATFSLLPVATTKSNISALTHKLDVSHLTVQQLAFIESRRLIAEKLFTAVKDRLKKLPAEELASVGLELAPGRNQLEVKDANGAIDLLTEEGLIDEDEVLPLFNLQNGKLEELVIPRIVAKTPGLNQAAAKNILRAKLAPFIDYENPANRTAPLLKDKT